MKKIKVKMTANLSQVHDLAYEIYILLKEINNYLNNMDAGIDDDIIGEIETFIKLSDILQAALFDFINEGK
jgi:hypothetical protein